MGKLALVSIFFFTVLTVSVSSELTDAECQQESVKCFEDFYALSTTASSPSDKCNAVIVGLNCTRNLGCITDVNIRLLFIQAKEYLKTNSVTCNEIDQELYSTKADACEERVQQCLFTYVDRLYALSAQIEKTSGKNALCQYLSEYIDCIVDDGTCKPEDNCQSKKENCHPSMEELKTIVEDEQTRMQVNGCVVAKIDTGTLTVSECASAYSQCQTIDDLAESSMLCEKTQEAIKCATGFDCPFEVLLRLHQLQEKDKSAEASMTCEIDNLFPTVQPGSDACKEGRQECLYTYVDTLRELDKNPSVGATELCKKFRSYIFCQLNVMSCTLNFEEMKKLRDLELMRTNIQQCDIDDLNHGVKETSSLLLLTLLVLAALIFQ